MNNFELDRRAKELAASNSGYNLARRFLMLEDQLSEARREAEQPQQAQVDFTREELGTEQPAGIGDDGTPAPSAVPEALIDALKSHSQGDEEGIMCIVSRQAVCEAIDILEQLPSEPASAGPQ